jgi:hypothetical protein
MTDNRHDRGAAARDLVREYERNVRRLEKIEVDTDDWLDVADEQRELGYAAIDLLRFLFPETCPECRGRVEDDECTVCAWPDGYPDE